MKECLPSSSHVWSQGFRAKSERGIAMILTLAILVVVTLLVVAFAVSMRVENTASKNFNDLIKARQLAQGGVDEAVAALRVATPPGPLPGNPPTCAWVAAPGVIYGFTSGGGITTSNIFTDPAVVGNNGTVDLNANFAITGKNTFYTTPANASIFCTWQNVTLPLPSGELVGRFAYWTDVESAKVTINTAELRTAPNPTSTIDPLMKQSAPGDVDMRALEDVFYENPVLISGTFFPAHSTPPLQPLFATAEEMRRGLIAPATADSGAAAYTANKFYVTVSGAETNTDAFGRDRIDLLAGFTQGDIDNPASPIRSLFKDSAWATVLYPNIVTDPTRKTLEGKYGQFGAQQILANILDYQVSYLTPSVGNTPTGTKLSSLLTGQIPLLYSGLKKGPMIDDVIVQVLTNSVVDAGNSALTDLVVHVFVDVKLVNGYEIPRGIGYQLNVQPGAVIFTNAALGAVPLLPAATLATTVPFTINVPAHSFGELQSVGIATPPGFTYTKLGDPINNPPVALAIAVNLSYVTLLSANNPANIVDWMDPSDCNTIFPLGMTFKSGGLGDMLPFTGTPNFTGPFSATTFNPIAMGKQDPRVRTFPGRIAGAGGDFANGGLNLQTNWYPLAGSQVIVNGDDALAYSSRISPEAYNLLADQRSVEPNAGNPTQSYLIDQIAEAPFQSVGEVGYIHTGYPWRTLRLRSVYPETSPSAPFSYADRQMPAPYSNGSGDPNLSSEQVELNALPDWVTLDMFKIGPSVTTTGININAKFTGPAANLAFRTPPLIALIDNTSLHLSTSLDTPGNFGTNVDAIATNIVIRAYVPNLAGGAANRYAALPAFLTPGEICEVEGLNYFSDTVGGPPPCNLNPSKTRREQMIRRIANLITTRSDTFMIWCIAQTVKKVDKGTPGAFITGTDLITGEAKVQAIVQRYEDPTTSPATVKFRTLYYRYIYN